MPRALPTFAFLFCATWCVCRNEAASNPSSEAPSASPNDAISIEREETWRVAGREFYLSLEKLPPPPNVSQPQYTLKITGDCPHIELTYPGEAPTLTVVADKVIFSGHTFEATADRAVFKIDGVAHELGSPGAIMFIFVHGNLVAALSH
jgi:hypothetical protein